MRRLLLILLFVLSFVAVTPAQAPQIGPNDAIAFDYFQADLTGFAVNRFEVQWDGAGAWVSIGIPLGFTDAQTLGGATSYQVLVPFSSGTHALSVRACNTTGCGGGSSPFAFAVLSAPTGAPGNLRRIPRR